MANYPGMLLILDVEVYSIYSSWLGAQVNQTPPSTPHSKLMNSRIVCSVCTVPGHGLIHSKTQNLEEDALS